jgi:hypothetical protein
MEYQQWRGTTFPRKRQRINLYFRQLLRGNRQFPQTLSGSREYGIA